MQEAPLAVLEEEFGKIVELELEKKNNERTLKEERQKVDSLIKTGIDFSNADLNERQQILDSSTNQEVEFVYSNLLDAGRSNIEQFIKVFLLGAIESRGLQLNLILEEDLKHQLDQGKFDTFNPVSFGPGAPLNKPNFVKNLESLDFKIEEENSLKKENEELEDEQKNNEAKLEEAKTALVEITQEIELEKHTSSDLDTEHTELE
jgi:hypothetical protein